MRIVRAGDCRTTPWKNGRGATTEIAVEPPGASLDNFDWRVSLACIASDGPFSSFAGIDRSLAVVQGSGLELTIGNAAAVVLDRESDPVRFDGDLPSLVRLLSGSNVDLNVMTRRGRFSHRLQRVRSPSRCAFHDHDLAIIVACSGVVTLTSPPADIALAAGDAVILPRDETDFIDIQPAISALCYLILLRCDQPG